MPYNFHSRLNRNKERFEELSLEDVLVQYADTEFPIQASPIHKRPYTLTTMSSLTQVERLWWGISIDQLFIPTAEPIAFLPEPGMQIIRELEDRIETYSVIAEDPNSPCYRYTTANRDRIIVCTVLEMTEAVEETP